MTYLLLARNVRSSRLRPTSRILHRSRLGLDMTLARRPADATLSVTKAARLLGVHANTIRAWSDQGRLRFYRINQRGDRRYRLGDLQQFLAKAESRPEPARGRRNLGGVPARPVAPSIGADVVELRTRPSARMPAGPTMVLRSVASRAVHEAPARTRLDIAILAHLADLVAGDADPDIVMRAAVEHLHDRAGHDLVAVLERRDGRLVTRTARGVGADRLGSLVELEGLPDRALRAEGRVRSSTTSAPMDGATGRAGTPPRLRRPRAGSGLLSALARNCWRSPSR